MVIEQNRWTRAEGWESRLIGRLGPSAQLVLLFGGSSILKEKDWYGEMKKAYPNAHLFGCSTAGEIFGTQVSDDSLVFTAVKFDYSRLQGARVAISDLKDSFAAGERLGQSLNPTGLVHALVLSDGLMVNGSELVRGLTKGLPPGVSITGGLSGDGERFKETLILCDGPAEQNTVGVLGLYGERLEVGYGSMGGWDSFGPERLITRSNGNVLYELDGKSALDLYTNYLGEQAKGLPATGLLYPLSLRIQEGATGVVRTILSVNEKEKSMTFAGDVPEGAYVRLMKANFDRLIDGAVDAAKTSYEAMGSSAPDLAILIRLAVSAENWYSNRESKKKRRGFGRFSGIEPLSPVSILTEKSRRFLATQNASCTTKP